MRKNSRQRKGSFDYYLILATCVVLTIISVICVYGMFYFKFAQIQQLAPHIKTAYMEKMNLAVSPFIISLILLLAICVPKRLVPSHWLKLFALMVPILVVVGFVWGVVTSLQVSLCVSLLLQLIVLLLALFGNENLNFEKKGYWLRVGSSAIHLGLILFILDLFYYQKPTLHLLLFWVTTAATVVGMICSFYSEAIATLLRKRKQ